MVSCRYLFLRQTRPMGLKALGAKIFARIVVNKVRKWSNKPLETQEKVFRDLMKTLANTSFGKDHGINPNDSYEDFKTKVPVRDYEQLKPYFDRIANAEENVCWPGKPIYLAKTSGTTSGAKYIPITKESIPNHINSARNALLTYIFNSGNASWVDGKLIFLSGSPTLEKHNGILTGRLSGIVNHHVPGYLRRNQMPSWTTNCLEDWEEKVNRIAMETVGEKMTLISGIPPWVQMYFDILTEMSDGKKVGDIFPEFTLFVYGGVNFEPYREKLEASIGRKVDRLETFPASEGFFAYQDQLDSKELLLLLNDGIFFEFIPLENYFDENPPRYSIKEVEVGKNYALIINSNAGLWGYSIGDTVKIESKNPVRVTVSGRIKHFISAFGEHVIGSEVEYALEKAIGECGGKVTEFTVAPQVTPLDDKLPYHEWLVEFEEEPSDMKRFAAVLDKSLQEKNTYYKDLITGNILRPCVIRSLPKHAFIDYMRSQGKLGGQNKVPRLSNDRKIADAMLSGSVND